MIALERHSGPRAGAVVTEAGFVDGVAGALLRVRSRCVPPSLATALLVAPLGEEMNRSRRFLSALRVALAEGGAEAVSLDPYGSGDSAGEMVDARWQGWVDDFVAEADRLRSARGAAPVLVGLRSGSLLVTDVAARFVCLGCAPSRVVHVQPEPDGAAVLRRWLRTRVAKARLAGDGRETVASLRARLAAGETLDLGGYRLAPALAEALEGRAFDPGDPALAGGVHQVEGRPFWQLEDCAPDPALVARVARLVLA